MTLSELADLGELVGGVAVVASLVYLALQVRQNTRAVRGSTLHLNTGLWGSTFLRLSDQAVAQAHFAGMSGRPDIKPLHYTQFFFVDALIAATPETDPGVFLREWQRIARPSEPAA